MPWSQIEVTIDEFYQLIRCAVPYSLNCSAPMRLKWEKFTTFIFARLQKIIFKFFNSCVCYGNPINTCYVHIYFQDIKL